MSTQTLERVHSIFLILHQLEMDVEATWQAINTWRISMSVSIYSAFSSTPLKISLWQQRHVEKHPPRSSESPAGFVGRCINFTGKSWLVHNKPSWDESSVPSTITPDVIVCSMSRGLYPGSFSHTSFPPFVISHSWTASCQNSMLPACFSNQPNAVISSLVEKEYEKLRI